MDRHVTLAVEYRPDATDAQRSLSWLAPDLARAGLMLSEEDDVRKWRGVIDGDTYARFADAWGLNPDLGSQRHVLDGTAFEHRGFSPIVWVSLSVSEPANTDPVKPNLPFVYLG